MAFHQLMCVTLLTLLTKESSSQLADCGQASLNTRIVGGQTAPAGNWPWQVSLQKPTHFCGGSLINNLWVMTAAHCVPDGSPSGLTVQLGLQSLQGSNQSNQVSRTVAQVIVHPSYSSQTNDNDIALLRLSSSVTFTPYIRPVCLAASDSTFYSGVNSWVTGWGNVGSGVSLPAPQNLMEVEVPVVGNRQCNCDYGVGRITNNMICAGLAQGGKDSCQGDSGGPMVSKQGSVWIQEGIVSFGDGCAQPNFPGVYTRVSQYQSWINSQITTNQPGFITFTSSGTDSDLSVSCPGLPPITTTTTTTTTPTTTTNTTTTTTNTTPTTTTNTTTTTTTNTTTTTTTNTTTTTTTNTTTTSTTKPATTTTTTTPTTFRTTTTSTTALTQSTTPGPVVCGQAPLNFGPLGGSLASAGEWPWIVSLQKNGQHVCGGTLVSENSVLSSANCFSSSPNASEWTVVLGRLKQNGTNPFEVSLNVANITLSNLTGSNIALLQLSSRPPLSNYIQPICLENGRTFPEGSTCWASGWSAGRGGEEQVLQEYQTSVVNCGNVSVSNSICTSLFTLEQGDSGGPLMCKQDGSWFQVVVLSFVSSPTRKKRQTPVMIFDQLTHFQDFLVESLGTFLSPPSENNQTTTTMTTTTPMTTTTTMRTTTPMTTTTMTTTTPMTTTTMTTTTPMTTTTMIIDCADDSILTCGGTYNHLSFFLFCLHLFVLTLCLQLFS